LKTVKRLPLIVGALILALAAACIKKDTRATWYIDPLGGVTWAVAERDIRSDANARSERLSEEDQYLAAVKGREHPAATGLKRIGASGVKASIVRDKAPFTVETEGQFPGLDVLGRRFLATYGFGGSSTLTRDDGKWVWTFTLTDEPATELSEIETAEVTTLLGDTLTVALREGRFVKAEGFDLDGDGRIATLKGDVLGSSPTPDKPIVLKLVWQIE
jgi:hypothetical protein